MDLAIALAGDGTAREGQVRLKLQFEDRSMLNSAQLQAGLANSWFLVGGHLRSIADLASHISVAFGLLNSCPHGITLRMENFTLPPPQSVYLLKDKDIVSVMKTLASTDADLQQIKYADSSDFSFDKTAPLEVKAPALKELEMKTKGNESELEEGNEMVEARQKALKPNTTKSKEKKRKWVKTERTDDKGKTQLQVVSCTGGLTREEKKERKSKRQKLMVQLDDVKTKEKKKDKKANKQGFVTLQDDCQKEKKKDKKENKQGLWTLQDDKHESDETKECAKGHGHDSSAVVMPQNKKKKQAITADVPSEQPRVQKQPVLKSDCKTVSCSNSDSSSDEKSADKESEPLIEGEHVKKVSRSTLRKKAKRRWIREQKELAKKLSDQVGDKSRKAAGNMVVAKQEKASLNFVAKQEDDGDAEEERLPHVVRPGHIRFEPLEEDVDDDLHSRHPLPLLSWSNGISKRKGQNWGQEKARRGYKNLEVINNIETRTTTELNFEALPLLKGTPQHGDIIAYRIVELTSSLCPELSEYRVGKVVNLASQSGVVKLAEVANHPLRKKPSDDDADNDAETNEDALIGSLYDKEGFLETQISSLLDIRVVESSMQEECGAEPTKQASPEQLMTDNHTTLNASMVAMPTADNDTTLNSSTMALATTENETYFFSSSMAAHQKDADIKTTRATPIASEEAHLPNAGTSAITPIASAEEAHLPNVENSAIQLKEWTEVFDAIKRKKQELGKEGDSVPAAGAVEPDRANGCGNGCSTVTSAKKEASGGRVRGWHKRAGGLGATIALLRSQNTQ